MWRVRSGKNPSRAKILFFGRSEVWTCGARPQRRAASARPKSARSASEGLALRGVGNGRAGPEGGCLACLCTHPFCARELAGAILRLEGRVAFACCLTGLSGCLQVLFPIRICGSLNVRFWPSIFRLPPSHFSALEVVFPSFSAFSCVYPGVIRRPLSLQCG